MVDNLPAETQLGSNCNPDAIKANLFCRTSAERVRNECGTGGEPVQKGKPENDRIKKTNMPESRNNFIVHGPSGTFAGIGTFHIRGRKTFLRKIRAKPSVSETYIRYALKYAFL